MAGGGTGGHLFPGLAIAKGLSRKLDDGDILFVIGRKSMEKEIVTKHGFRVKAIDVEGIIGKNAYGMLISVLKVIKGLIHSLAIVRAYRPCLVMGVGGYAAGPVCLAAWLFRVPVGIHEQNSVPGITNRMLSPLAARVFISFEESMRYLRSKNICISGNPVREEILLSAGEAGKSRKRGEGQFVLMAMGGSQGSIAINRAVLSALDELRREGYTLSVIHQTGRDDLQRVVREYSSLGLKGEVKAFIENMSSAYHRADLVVCRAGATTIAELSALGIPSILVPYPYAANRHQDINARALAECGGADIIPENELNGKSLAARIRRYMENRDELEKMSSLAFKAGRRDAGKVIVEGLVELVGQGTDCFFKKARFRKRQH